MKKILFTIALALFTGSVMAQTPEEKAAAKAAKAALREATKQANKKLSDGMACAAEVQTLYQAIQMEQQKGESSNDLLIAENEAKIQTVSLEGIALLTEALSTEYIKDNKKFQAYKALDDMATMVLNSELVKASKKEPYNREALASSIFAITDACHGQLTWGKEEDQTQNLSIQSVKLKFPKTHTYYAYLCQFCIEAKDLEGAQKALDAYINFPVKYPEMADNEIVKNPEYPASQFAFNIFYTAFNDKNVELMDKYYDLALQFDNKESHNFVLRAKPQMLKDQGKTEEWIVAMKEMIALAPDSEVGEIGMQQLMSHYNSAGNEAVDAYTKELVEKYPESKVANYCRGFAFYAKSDFSNAITFFQKSVEIDPDYADGVYNCGYCYYQNALEKAREISGKKMKSQAAIKAAEDEVKGLFAKAAPYFERYRELEDKDPSKWASPLKVIYNNIGEKEKAAEMDAYLN
ncbi:MAG: tetratricopeptide repeat protein [Bacteroidaceae bacterium]|nr:tetratricopeptide repeat protein [Bacteroidaceae bacterium]